MKNTQDQITAIGKKIFELRQEQVRLETTNFQDELRPQISASIGKTFAYRRNCYSCPSKAEDYWDIFRKLVDVQFSELHAWLIFQEVQIDSYGNPRVTLAYDSVSSRESFPKLASGWAPCEEEEFEKNYRAALDQFNTHSLYSKHWAADEY